MTSESDPATAAVAAGERAQDSPASDVSATQGLEDAIQSTQQALEQLRREVEQNGARHAAAITSSLSLIEPTLSRLHERQLEAVQSSNRTVLIVAGIFAAVAFVGVIVITLILVRAMGRFSEMAVMAGPRHPMLGAGTNAGMLGAGDHAAGRPSAADEASGRFHGALEQLQKRILELEQSAQGSPSTGTPARTRTTALNIEALPALPTGGSASNQAEAAAPASRAALLLGKGQALLNLDAAEPALQCFEEAISAEPNNAEAFVKKGMALEKLQDWEQALESYDRALALDDSLTVAHLYRGGVCNRLQRYREALESYERALRSENKVRAS